MEIIDVYVAHGDGGERGIGPIVGVCSTETNAKMMSKGRGWYGGNGHVGKRKALKITTGRECHEIIYLLDKAMETAVQMDTDIPKLIKERKEAALNKLTKEERILLGLERA